MTARRALPAAELSEIVRERLRALLAEVPPRRSEGLGEHGDATRVVRRAPDSPDDAADPRKGGGAGIVGEPDALATDAGTARREAGTVAGAARRGLAFAREHLVAVAVIVLAGALWTGYGLVQARSTPVAVALTTPAAASSPTPAGSQPVSAPAHAPGSASPAATVLVHVLGAVRKPGVVSLASGSRVADAIKAAGGLASDAAPAELNLAAVVSDGSQIVIGRRGRPRGEIRQAGEQAGATSPSSAAAINLNTATLAQLDTLPGVGPVTAQKILDWRSAHGRFSRVQELQEVDGIGPKTYADLAPHVSV